MIHNGKSKLPYDPIAAVEHLSNACPKLATLIERAGPLKLKIDSRVSIFESLLESILYQQLNGKAAATIHARFRELYSGDPSPKALLSTPDELLRGCGVSSNKTRAMKDLAERTLDGTVQEYAALKKMSDEEIITRLSTVRGIGRWTVEMLLIFRLGRADVFPVTDYGIRKGFALTYLRLHKTRAIEAADLPKPAIMEKRAKKWAPYRSVASWYLWRACDLAKSTPPTGRSSRKCERD
jgi:DNA-3-methyladenine glycosylase II